MPMDQTLRCQIEYGQRAKWGYIARSRLLAVSYKKKVFYTHIIKPLLKSQRKRKNRTLPISSHLDLTLDQQTIHIGGHQELYQVTTTTTPRATWIIKMHLYPTYESRDTLKSFSLFFFIRAISRLIMEHIVKFKTDMNFRNYPSW